MAVDSGMVYLESRKTKARFVFCVCGFEFFLFFYLINNNNSVYLGKEGFPRGEFVVGRLDSMLSREGLISFQTFFNSLHYRFVIHLNF